MSSTGNAPKGGADGISVLAAAAGASERAPQAPAPPAPIAAAPAASLLPSETRRPKPADGQPEDPSIPSPMPRQVGVPTQLGRRLTADVFLLLLVACLISSLASAFQPTFHRHQRRLRWCHRRVANDLNSVGTSLGDAGQADITFVTDKMHVYIEDTDAYGVMYNANYLRAYERALHVVSVRPPSYVQIKAAPTQSNGDDGDLPLVEGGALNHAGWFVSGVTEHRFKGSPPLGGEFVVKGELLSRNCAGGQADGCAETWKVYMTSCCPPGEEDGGEEDETKEKKETVYNSAVITVASPVNVGLQPNPSLLPTLEDGATVRSTFTPYRDEFDANIPHHMPLRNVLNLFERARSNYLGGPDELRRMQVEDNVLWVVTGVDSCEMVNLSASGSWEEGNADGDEEVDVMDADGEGDSDTVPSSSRVRCRPGHDVTVKTNFAVKRGGMVLDCRQTLLVPVWDAEIGQYRNRRLAQGIVTIMALNGTTRRPTRKIPAWFLEKVMGSP